MALPTDGPGPAEIHGTAIVEQGARIGPGTRLWHHVHVRSGASIGENCNLGKNVYVDTDTVIGHRVKLQNNASVFAGVELGDDVFVGPGAVITNDRVPRATGPWEVIRTRVGQGASIGANATVIGGIEVGPWALVGAGAVVTHSVDAHELVAGNPARRLGWICRCGKARAGSSDVSLRCVECATELEGLDRSS